MKILKNVFFIFLVVIFSYLLSHPFGNIYATIFHDHGSFVNAVVIAGAPLVYILFIPFIFTAFGDKKKYWWI